MNVRKAAGALAPLAGVGRELFLRKSVGVWPTRVLAALIASFARVSGHPLRSSDGLGELQRVSVIQVPEFSA